MSDVLPFSLENLAGAAIRPILMPITGNPATDLPDQLTDIFEQISPYEPEGTWFNVGATAGPSQVSRNLTVSGYTIEQSQDTVLDEPQTVVYNVTIPMAEFRPEVVQLAYEGRIETVAAATGRSAGKKIHYGSIEELSHFRVALVTKLKKVQGTVREGAAGPFRGRYLVYVAYDGTLAAENLQTAFGKGQLAQLPVTFKINPIQGRPEGEEHGYFFIEDAGVISLT